MADDERKARGRPRKVVSDDTTALEAEDGTGVGDDLGATEPQTNPGATGTGQVVTYNQFLARLEEWLADNQMGNRITLAHYPGKDTMHEYVTCSFPVKDGKPGFITSSGERKDI